MRPGLGAGHASARTTDLKPMVPPWARLRANIPPQPGTRVREAASQSGRAFLATPGAPRSAARRHGGISPAGAHLAIADRRATRDLAAYRRASPQAAETACHCTVRTTE